MRIVRDFIASCCAGVDPCSGGITTRRAPQAGHSTVCPTISFAASISCLQETQMKDTKLFSSAISDSTLDRWFYAKILNATRIHYLRVEIKPLFCKR